MLLQQKHGLFPRILGKGDHAHRLMELLLRMRTEAATEEALSASRLDLMPSATIESLIIIDREVDFATVLLTQLTYEGLIDELYHIQDNQADIETSVVGPVPGQQGKTPTVQSQQNLSRKIQLDSSDKVYEQLRDTNIAAVGKILNKVARRLAGDYELRHTTKTTSELKDFVSKLPGYQVEQQSVNVHTGLAEKILKHTDSDLFTRVIETQQNLVANLDLSSQHDAIEELIARDTPLPAILRLLCLESCISGGIRAKDLENFKRLILHAYGFQHLLTLDALEKMHLLEARASANVLSLPLPGGGGGPVVGTKTNYNYLRNLLRLIVNEVNAQDPSDIAYVYSGYAPLSIRLVQCIIQKPYLTTLTKGATSSNGVSTAAHGWQGFEDAVKNVKGETFNKVQKGEEQATKARQVLSGAGGKKTVVVMFLGGITFTEIAALRFIAKSEEGKRNILICTTGIVSGDRLVGSAVEKGTFGKV